MTEEADEQEASSDGGKMDISQILQELFLPCRCLAYALEVISANVQLEKHGTVH